MCDEIRLFSVIFYAKIEKDCKKILTYFYNFDTDTSRIFPEQGKVNFFA